MKLTSAARGVYVIAATPFHPDGSLDLDGARSMIDFYLARGAHGLTLLGMMGEQQKLSPEESLQFVDTCVRHVDGRVPIIVGAATPWIDNLKTFARGVMDAGASALMFAPMTGLRSDDQITGFVERVCNALHDVPLVLQDYPQSTGVILSPALINRLIDRFTSIVMFKHEDQPGLSKLTTLRKHQTSGGRRVSILVGNGAIHYVQELARGADGAMTGFSYPEMMVDVFRLWEAGKQDEAEDLYDAYLPLVRHELQPGQGLAIRKYILMKRGAFKSDHVRMPGPTLTALDRTEIDHLIRRLEQRLA
ncbi:MAG: dihydrodipicolinate synthase family protein [Burkholderiales bacterium]